MQSVAVIQIYSEVIPVGCSLPSLPAFSRDAAKTLQVQVPDTVILAFLIIYAVEKYRLIIVAWIKMYCN